MTEAMRQDVLGQKAQAARRAYEARAMSPAKALRRALSRTADLLWDLALVTQGVSQEMLDQDGVIEALRPGELLLLLDGPDGAVGLVSIDRELMTGLIEVQTIQQVTQIPIENRPLTPTDAAMMAPLIDGTLGRLVENLEGHPICPQLDGYRFGAMIEDSRGASLLLDASSYRLFRVSMDLALGRRRGEMQLIFPERDLRSSSFGAPDALGPYEKRVKLLPAKLDAVLARVRIPLRKVRGLKPGELIPLPPEVLDGVELLAGEGKIVARGRLGQLNGMRAVRLTWPEMAGRGEGPGDLLDGEGFEAEDAAGGLAALSAPEEAGGDFDFGGMDSGFEAEETPDFGGFGGDEPEELPDLPSLDFDGGGDFDFSSVDAAGEGEGGEELPDLGDFAGGSMDFDFEDSDDS